MALEAFVAGRYTVGYNSVDAGIQKQGIRISQVAHEEEIRESDAYGDSLIDTIYRGGDVSCMLECLGFKAAGISMFWPFAALGVMQLTGTGPAPIGRLGSALAQALVLTAVLGTAYNTSGATAVASLTATLAKLAPETPQEVLFNSRLRTIPLKLHFLPTEATASGTTTTRWFSTT